MNVYSKLRNNQNFKEGGKMVITSQRLLKRVELMLRNHKIPRQRRIRKVFLNANACLILSLGLIIQDSERV